MANKSENLTIGAFAQAAGVNVETIRLYQRKGLLLAPDKPYGGIRRYGEADVSRVRFVKSAQRLGFSLDEIADGDARRQSAQEDRNRAPQRECPEQHETKHPSRKPTRTIARIGAAA